MNPFLEDLYTQHPSNNVSQPQDFEPIYFETELERRAAFLLMQTSVFYHYWTTYGNQRNLNWGLIKAFPFPKQDDLETIQDEIFEMSERMWEEMKPRFNGRDIENCADIKPLADKADEILGPLISLNEDEIK